MPASTVTSTSRARSESTRALVPLGLVDVGSNARPLLSTRFRPARVVREDAGKVFFGGLAQ